MIVNLFEDNDIDIINKNMNDIMTNAEKYKNTYGIPNIKNYKQVKEYVLKYIKEKKRIIYGGEGWNILINSKNKKDSIYDEYSMNDIDFYSYEPIKDIFDICNLLSDKNFKYVQGANAFKEEAYKIYVNFTEIVNISYMPKYIYHKIDKYTIDGYNIIGNNIILIDLLRQFVDPINSLWRLDKNFKRGNILLKHFPLKLNNNGNEINKLNDNEKKLGLLLFNYLTSESNNNIFIDRNILEIYLNPTNDYIEYNNYNIEIITDNLKQTTIDINNYILNNFNDNDNIKIEQYHKFFQFYDHKIIFKYNDNVILTIYGNNNICIPYNVVKLKNNNKINIGTFNVCILYLLIKISYNKINKIYYKDIELLLYNLFKAKKLFLNKNKMTILDNSIYKDFKIDCIGQKTDNKYIYLLKKNNPKKFIKSRINFYDPKTDKQIFKIDDYKFKNSSGNINTKFNIDNYT